MFSIQIRAGMDESRRISKAGSLSAADGVRHSEYAGDLHVRVSSDDAPQTSAPAPTADEGLGPSQVPRVSADVLDVRISGPVCMALLIGFQQRR